jgi:large conductance mechanosensitive channel
MLKEFGEFICKGNVVMIAVGLVLALHFQAIVDALLDGVINPIIAAIFGKESFLDIGFDPGDSRINLGLVIDAIISFVVVAFILFLVVKAYNRMSREDAKGPATGSPCSARSGISSPSVNPDMAGPLPAA